MEINNLEAEIKISNLMKELQQITAAREFSIAPLLQHIDVINEELENISKPFEEDSDKIKKEIEILVLLLKKSVKTGSGNITYVKGAVRRNWNLDALDLACEDDSYIKEQIWKFREEKEGQPQVRIKVELKGTSINDI